MRKLAAALSCIALGACATADPAPRYFPAIATQFDPAEIVWFSEPGAGRIDGSAVLRTVGGEARTCAGLQAHLVPLSSYAEARFRMMYPGQGARGYLPATRGLSWAETDPGYEAATRSTVCDAQGNFTFDRLPDGEYFVTAQVTWGVPNVGRYYSYTSVQGGMLMQQVRVAEGETQRIVLSAE